MKKSILILCLFMLSAGAQAEVWEKPKYEADENHLPQNEVIEFQEQQERQEEQKSQATEPPSQKGDTFKEMDDQLKTSEEFSL